MGSSAFERDMAFYRQVLGADRVWQFEAFEAKVAAVRLSDGPLLLIADHRPAPSCILVFEVDDLEQTADMLRARGWESSGDPFEIPNGPCYIFSDPSGNPLAIFEDQRPEALERSFSDQGNGIEEDSMPSHGEPPT